MPTGGAIPPIDPQLEQALIETKPWLRSGQSPGRYADRAANAKLVVMENRAFELVHLAHLSEAQALLHSKEYEEQKRFTPKAWPSSTGC